MATNPRDAIRPVDPLFLERWSPRAFDGSAVAQADLETIFDAARWAPSAFNYQPWRFVYAHRDSADWERFLALLLPFNRAWAEQAGVLLFALSDRLIEAGGNAPRPSHSHSFDTGAAWALLALQAIRLGYHSHGMTGIDFDHVRGVLGVPERFHVEAAIALGRVADKSILPEALQAREGPSGRHDIGSFAFEGRFPGN
jgi:nitroreductase